MTLPTLQQHLSPVGPKRILTCDGGGVRGIITLAFLSKIESILRQRYGGCENFRLCHYFDLIGGTSTGAIIAAGLAKGMAVAELQVLYRELAETVFPPKPEWAGLWSAKFEAAPLEAMLKEQFGDLTLGGAGLRTGLMIVAKRFDTRSPWVLHNNPNGPFFSPADTSIWPNKYYPLWQLIRASTAAPHYFEPELIPVDMGPNGAAVKGAFIDGGVSPHNNPALQAVMLATLKGHGWNWELGEEKMLVISAGTGFSVPRMTAADAMKKLALVAAKEALLGMIGDASELNKQIMQWLGRTPMPWKIDAEVGDLSADDFGGKKWFTYVRYDTCLDAFGTPALVSSLNQMDQAENVPQLEEIGNWAAEDMVLGYHFPSLFDLAGTCTPAAPGIQS